MVKNCDNCIYSDRPSYDYPCTACTSAYGSDPTKWEGEKPTATANVSGRWIRMENKYVSKFKCSICHSECYVPTCMDEPMYEYCPYCGKPMIGGAKNA